MSNACRIDRLLSIIYCCPNIPFDDSVIDLNYSEDHSVTSNDKDFRRFLLFMLRMLEQNNTNGLEVLKNLLLELVNEDSSARIQTRSIKSCVLILSEAIENICLGKQHLYAKKLVEIIENNISFHQNKKYLINHMSDLFEYEQKYIRNNTIEKVTDFIGHPSLFPECLSIKDRLKYSLFAPTEAYQKGDQLDFLSLFNITKNKLLQLIEGSNLQLMHFVQIISPGRCGTLFLQTLLNHESKYLPIHNLTFTLCTNIRQLISIANAEKLGIIPKRKFTLSKDWANYVSNVVSSYLFLFLIEMSHHIFIEEKHLVIINHWLSDFTLILSECFPNLKFVCLGRNKVDFINSQVNKEQIVSNPMPPEMYFRNIELSKILDNRSYVIDWANYFLDYNFAIQNYIKNTLSDRYEGICCLTPPIAKDAEFIIKRFNLSDLSVSDIINRDCVNLK